MTQPSYPHAPPELVFTRNWKLDKGWSLHTYRSTGGYQAIEKALKMEPAAIIQTVTDANIRGRGGAGFPAGKKWSFIPKDSKKPKYLCVNADESEPGTFKDRYIMERDPHMLIEGIAIACRAVGAHHAYVYIRGEFGLAYTRLQAAVDEAYEAGIIGKSLLGTDYALDVVVHRGAGAYICGEETALLESLEGRKGQPRLKPPFPAIEGFFACPTVVNNVETIAAVPHIISRGADWWKSLAKTPAEGGTKLVGISGHVRRPGVYELPNGLTLRQIIYDVGGGMRDPSKPLKAVIPGGSSCPLLTPDKLDTPYDFDSIKKAGSMMGTGCPTVIEEGTCIVRLLRRVLRFYAHESCGQCTPCREGGDWLFKMIDRIERGQGRQSDLDNIDGIAAKIEGHTICPFGEALSWPTRSYVKTFRDEFARHIQEKRCPFGEIELKTVAMSGVLP